MPTTDSFNNRGRVIKFFNTADEAWRFLTDLDNRYYKVLDYGKMSNFECYPYYALYQEKDAENS